MLPKKPDREQAIEILLICANRGEDRNLSIANVGEQLEANLATEELARAAWYCAPGSNGDSDFEHTCLEAVCMLDTGWEPGDEIELLRTPDPVVKELLETFGDDEDEDDDLEGESCSTVTIDLEDTADDFGNVGEVD